MQKDILQFLMNLHLQRTANSDPLLGIVVVNAVPRS